MKQSPAALAVRIQPQTPQRWHPILTGFSDAMIDQTATYGQIRWPRARLEHAVALRGDRPAAAAQVVIYGPARLPGIAVVKFGPVWHRQGDADPDALRLLLDGLRSRYARRQRKVLRVIPPPAGAAEAGALLQGAGFTEVTPATGRYVVDLSRPVDDILANLKGRWRANLRKAWRHDLVVEHDTRPDAIERFLAMYQRMRAAKRFQEESAADDLPALCRALPGTLRPQTIACRKGDRTVAAAVVSVLGDTALYWFGAREPDARDLRAGYALHWRIAELLHARGIQAYDLGGDNGDEGLARFKSGMVGKAAPLGAAVATWEVCDSALSRQAIRLAERARRRLARARAPAASDGQR